MTEDQIEHMVQKFLCWKLPDNFNPDGGISFDPNKAEPSGTNLFDYNQAKEMVANMIEGVPPSPVSGWVIERGDSDVSAPKYWAGTWKEPERNSAWTSNHMEAIRFMRQEDALRVVNRALFSANVRICEHEWS